MRPGNPPPPPHARGVACVLRLAKEGLGSRAANCANRGMGLVGLIGLTHPQMSWHRPAQ